MYLCYSYKKEEEQIAATIQSLACRLDCLGIRVSSGHGDTHGRQIMVNENNLYRIRTELKRQQYAVIVVSEALLSDVTVLIELDLLEKLHECGQVVIFTILQDMDIDELPVRVEWMKQTCVLTVKNVTDIQKYAVVIAKAYWRGRLKEAADGDIVEQLYASADEYLSSLLSAYKSIEAHDIKSRELLLITIAKYLMVETEHQKTLKAHRRCIDTLLSQLGCGMPCTENELELLTYCIQDMLSDQNRQKG